MTIDEAIKHCLEVAEEQSRLYSLCPFPCDGTDNCMSLKNGKDMGCTKCAADHRQLAEWLKDLKEAKRLLQASEKTIDEYCRGYCECCKNRDFELARCGLVNGCRDKDNWEWILSYRVKELFKED